MGTRADFYIGRGAEAEWLGSIAWDGYPGGIPSHVLEATTPEGFKAALVNFAAERDDWTNPSEGWPWPWDDSRTTDYAYALDEGKVWGSCFGYGWFDATQPEPDREEDAVKTADFPNMAERKNVTVGKRSGVLIFTA